MSTKSRFVAYAHQDVSLTGFVTWDDAQSGRRPGVLVFHGGAGLDKHAQDRACRLAALGFVAFAADMYGDDVRGHRDRILQTITELRDDPVRMRARAQAALDWLVAHSSTDLRRGAVGYCFGGLVALELARGGADLAAVASIHGSLRTRQPAAPGSIRARVLVCHGALDPHVPMTDLHSFEDEMRNAGADWQVNVYGGALHGFTHDADGPSAPGVAYDAAADARSSAALKYFLNEAFE